MFKLIRAEATVADTADNRHQWPVRFTATYTEDDSPAYIFVMQAAAQTPEVFADSLSCIASAIQMTDLPVGSPAPGSPYYRLNDVTKLCRSSKAAEEFVEKVKDAVQDLADNLQAASTLSTVEEIIIEPSNL